MINLRHNSHFLNKFVVLLVLLLSSCDSGCVSAGAMGSSNITSVEVKVDPADYITTDTTTGNSVIMPDIGYNYINVYDSGGTNETCYSIWKPMNLAYDSNNEYSIAYSGSIETCTETATVPATAEAIFSAEMLDGTNATTSSDGSSISSLNAAFSTSSSYNFTIHDALAANPFPCLGEKVIIYEHFGGVASGSNFYTSSSGRNDSLGNTNNYICSSSSGCSFNTSFADISGLEIPRGCTVTFYDTVNGYTTSSASAVTLSVPPFYPSPYAYLAHDYRFDSSVLESNCGGRAIDDCISSVQIVQDPNSYEVCDSSKSTYLWKNVIKGDQMVINGTQSVANVNSTNYSGTAIGSDAISSFAVPKGCKLILYDKPNGLGKDTIVTRPSQIYGSEVFMPRGLCPLADKSSWGYQVSLDSEAAANCLSNESYFEDRIRSIRIEVNPVYTNYSTFSNAYSDSSDYKPEFYTLYNGTSKGALFFDGLSNFMVSDNIADYIRNSQYYKIRISFNPFCDSSGATPSAYDNCTNISSETESRVIFAVNQSNQDALGDYLAIGPDGVLELNGSDLGSNSYYNKNVTALIERNSSSIQITIYDIDSSTRELYSFASSGVNYNYAAEFFSLGQEWDYDNAPSQLYLGYIYDFALLDADATTDDLYDIDVLYSNIDVAYNLGVPIDINTPICNNNFNLNNIQIAYGTDTATNFTISNDDIVVNDVFTIPSGMADGDNFYFRIRNSDLSCDISVNQALEAYNRNSGAITIAVKEEDSSSTGLIAGLQQFIVEPIVSIFDCNDADCSGFYKTFYENVVAGTDTQDSLLQTLVKISLQFLIIMTGINFMFGLEKMTYWALMGRLLKVGLIYNLISPGSWEFFKDYVIVFVKEIPLEIGQFLTNNLALQENMASTASETVSMFDMMDNITGIFLSSDVHAKIWSMLFSSPAGFLMVLMMYYAIYLFFKGVISAMAQYVVIILLISLAIILAPVFIMFAILPFTAQFFAKWLDLIIGCAFKLMLLSLTVILFSYFTYAYVYNLFDYAACWKQVLYCCTFFPFQFSLLEFFAPVTFDYRRFGIDEVTASGPDFVEVSGFLIIVMMFLKFIDISESISSKLAKGTSLAGIGKDFNKSMESVYKSGTGMADKAAEKVYDKATNDPGSYKRMKNNVKRTLYDNTLGKLDEMVTGKLSQTKKKQANAMSGMFKGLDPNMEAEIDPAAEAKREEKREKYEQSYSGGVFGSKFNASDKPNTRLQQFNKSSKQLAREKRYGNDKERNAVSDTLKKKFRAQNPNMSEKEIDKMFKSSKYQSKLDSYMKKRRGK